MANQSDTTWYRFSLQELLALTVLVAFVFGIGAAVASRPAPPSLSFAQFQQHLAANDIAEVRLLYDGTTLHFSLKAEAGETAEDNFRVVLPDAERTRDQVLSALQANEVPMSMEQPPSLYDRIRLGMLGLAILLPLVLLYMWLGSALGYRGRSASPRSAG